MSFLLWYINNAKWVVLAIAAFFLASVIWGNSKLEYF